jgi:hypothetical protein
LFITNSVCALVCWPDEKSGITSLLARLTWGRMKITHSQAQDLLPGRPNQKYMSRMKITCLLLVAAPKRTKFAGDVRRLLLLHLRRRGLLVPAPKRTQFAGALVAAPPPAQKGMHPPVDPHAHRRCPGRGRGVWGRGLRRWVLPCVNWAGLKADCLCSTSL